MTCASVLRMKAALRFELLALGLSLTLVAAASWAQTPAPPLPVMRPLICADTLLGRSGNLRAILACEGSSSNQHAYQLFPRKVLARAARKPGLYDAGVSASDGSPVVLLSMVPFGAKRGSQLGKYRIGRWPQELAGSAYSYARPDGFIKVTKENVNTPVSRRFRLGDFLTHDQSDVWPKYLVLKTSLIDKLELIGDALLLAGRSDSVKILSGFRTPEYNAKGVGTGGRASDSRHMYGDAADIFVDGNGNGTMDDLNRDGLVSIDDARWLADLVERVEKQHPTLVGGLSAYPANFEHGPFVHTDCRGHAARW